jgi:hypothetical protein
MSGTRNASRILLGKPEWKGLLGTLGLDVIIILKWILKIPDM